MEAVETLFPVPALGRRIIMLERFCVLARIEQLLVSHSVIISVPF